MTKIDVILSPSWIPYKKGVVLVDGELIHFGDSRYEDYTTHHDDKRKANYLARHKKNEDWDDPSTAGFWSKHLLWNKKSIDESIKDIQKNYNIKITSTI